MVGEGGGSSAAAGSSAVTGRGSFGDKGAPHPHIPPRRALGSRCAELFDATFALYLRRLSTNWISLQKTREDRGVQSPPRA